MQKVRVHAFVSGIVQGVNFRFNTVRIAKSLGLTGWVKNLADGRVEVVAEGEEKNIEELIKFLRKGPPFSRVDKLDVKREEFKDEFKDFNILH